MAVWFVLVMLQCGLHPAVSVAVLCAGVRLRVDIHLFSLFPFLLHTPTWSLPSLLFHLHLPFSCYSPVEFAPGLFLGYLSGIRVFASVVVRFALAPYSCAIS